MEILTVAMQKGGAGKTTSAAILAQLATAAGKRVLAVDIDPQKNLSFALAAGPGPGTFEALEGKPAAECVQRSAQGMDVMRASNDLATITSGPGQARLLQRALAPIRDRYDLIFIDGPTTPGILQYNALQAATGLIIALEADIYGTHGIDETIETALQIKRSNPALSFKGIILTRYDTRLIFARQILEAVEAKAAAYNIPYLGRIRTTTAVREAAGLQQSLTQYAPNSTAAKDYAAVYKQIMED